MENRTYRLKYGNKEMEAVADRGADPVILSPPVIEPPDDPGGIIRQALETPIESLPLHKVVSGGDKIAIVASDTTRSTASDVFLPILVEELNAAGVPDPDISIVIALGIHRRQTEDEHRRLLGDALYERIKPIDHDARDDKNLVAYGETSRGTKVSVSRAVAEADKIVLTGAVSPHYFAGFGGGRKSIMPGVCSLEANLQSHLLVFNPPPECGRNPNVQLARLAGNPVHEDMLEAANMVGPHFILNTVVTPEKTLAAAFAGDMRAAHEAGCTYYLKNLSVVEKHAVDLTVVSCGGYPKDINFIQAHKAIHSAFSVTRPGGWMIVFAECRDGFGGVDFLNWFRFHSATDFEKELRAHYHIYGQTAYATFEKATQVNIILVTELAESDVKKMRMRKAESFEHAYRHAAENLPGDFLTCIVPAASSTLLLTEEEMAEAVASIT